MSSSRRRSCLPETVTFVLAPGKKPADPQQRLRGSGRCPSTSPSRRSHTYACANTGTRARLEYFGHKAVFNADGLVLDEAPCVTSQSDEELALQERASAETPVADVDEETVVFSCGALSRGPAVLPSDGSFTLESVMPHGGSRLSVVVEYATGSRGNVTLRWEAAPDEGSRGAGPFARMPPLDAVDIAGNWAGSSTRWKRGSEPTTQLVEREYSARNSVSDMLVRLPLGVSVVAPPVWSKGRGLSFGCAWSPVEGRRPVMIRAYAEDALLDKVDWRVEKQL